MFPSTRRRCLVLDRLAEPSSDFHLALQAAHLETAQLRPPRSGSCLRRSRGPLAAAGGSRHVIVHRQWLQIEPEKSGRVVGDRTTDPGGKNGKHRNINVDATKTAEGSLVAKIMKSSTRRAKRRQQGQCQVGREVGW